MTTHHPTDVADEEFVAEESESARKRRVAAASMAAPASAAMVAASEQIGSQVAVTALRHEAASSLGHGAANVLHHEAAVAAGAELAAGAGSASTATQGPSTQAVAVGGTVAAVAAAAVIAVAVTSGPDPIPQDEPPPTTAVVEPASPVSGPNTFQTEAASALDGNVVADADLAGSDSPLVVSEVEGSVDGLGTVVELASGANVTVQPNGTFRYEPAGAFDDIAPGDSAQDSFSVTVTDGTGWSDTWMATVSVSGVSTDLTIEAIEPITITAGETTEVAVAASGATSDDLVLAIDGDGPSFATLTESGSGAGTIAVAPQESDVGQHEIVIVASHPTAAQPATTTVSLTVDSPPEAPAPAVGRVTEGLVTLFSFDDGAGASAANSVDSGPALTITDPNAVTWADGALRIDSPTLLRADGPSVGIVDQVSASNQVTVEAWVTPANTSQSGPARIVTLSTDTAARNVTLAQGGSDGDPGDRWTSRVRSTETSENGLPGLDSPAGSVVADQLTHVTLTRAADGETRLYVDGQPAATGTSGGDLSSWDADQVLMVGNEATLDRPWLGSIHLVAVYGVALSPDQVDQNFQAGPNPAS